MMNPTNPEDVINCFGNNDKNRIGEKIIARIIIYVIKILDRDSTKNPFNKE